MTKPFRELSEKMSSEAQKLAQEKANKMLQEISELNVIQDPDFEKIAGVERAFFTRQGGVSKGVHTSLNCCYRGLDSPLNVQENRKRVMSFLGLPFESLVTTINVHGNKVITVSQPWNENNLPEADGMVTNLKNVVLDSDSADCLLSYLPTIFQG